VKRRSALGLALGFVAAIAFAGSTRAAFTGLTNGSFESGAYVDVSGGFERLAAGDPSIDGWVIGGDSVDWVGAYWPAADGAMSVDLSGTDAGSLSQTFDTTIGNTYTVSFSLAGNPAGPPTEKTLEVNATGGTTGLYSVDVTGLVLPTMQWATETYSFLATSASTTLTFTSTTAGAFGPALDNVAVTESVPVKDDCKDGGWQSMIDNAGNSFKNQGDCVSYFATKGKNLGAIPAATAEANSAAATETTTAAVKGSTKHAEKAAARSERHATKVKAHGQADKATTKSRGHGHTSGSKKPK
jgi:choice-of-anchor C domain-containing protein